MNNFLSMSTNIEKEAFWNFRESYEKYSGMATTKLMTDDQVKQSIRSFMQEECNSGEDEVAFTSMSQKVASSVAETPSRKANHKRSMVLFLGFERSEIEIFFRFLAYTMNNLK
ncbi:hypothetical protein MJO28_007070 [Puccinia striiformis f. sp. tritici]|uniref:Uncharacterized protein n=1 Tax=Puccinia striiformis f. sp. tritici TaxID=168172 RepID=A0ACC0EDC4_9BASI|nr:hypothetical protein MJO28_007070 [Puccinia striiformis f. sp. tritici]